jgi:hypothetical protein
MSESISRTNAYARSAGRPALQLKKSEIIALFDMPQPFAAQLLGVSVSGLKRGCRKLGIPHWPYKRSGHTSSKHAIKNATPSCRSPGPGEVSVMESVGIHSFPCIQETGPPRDGMSDFLNPCLPHPTFQHGSCTQNNYVCHDNFTVSEQAHLNLPNGHFISEPSLEQQMSWGDRLALLLSAPSSTDLADDRDFISSVEAQACDGYLELLAAEATACLDGLP